MNDEKQMFVDVANKMFEVLASEHEFDLSKSISSGEARRLLNFVELWEEPEQYVQFKDVSKMLFYAARLEARYQLMEQIQREESL